MQLTLPGINELMSVFPARRTGDDTSGRNRNLFLAESQYSFAVDDVNHFFIAAMRVIGKRGLAGQDIEETVAELPCADLRAHALPLSAKRRTLRRIDLFHRNFRKLDYVLIFCH